MSNEIELIDFNNCYYIIEKDEFEPREYYFERVWFILNNLIKSTNINELIKNSRIWINKIMYGCEY